jgi:transposase
MSKEKTINTIEKTNKLIEKSDNINLRAMVADRCVHQMSTREIAEKYNTSESTIRRRLRSPEAQEIYFTLTAQFAEKRLANTMAEKAFEVYNALTRKKIEESSAYQLVGMGDLLTKGLLTLHGKPNNIIKHIVEKDDLQEKLIELFPDKSGVYQHQSNTI